MIRATCGMATTFSKRTSSRSCQDRQRRRITPPRAAAIIAVAALLDTHASIQTRPVNLYWTQAAMAFAAVYFMGGAIMEGLLRALSKGPSYIISFSAVFGLSQTLGGLFGVAVLSAYHTLRTKAHLMAIGDGLISCRPNMRLPQAMPGCGGHGRSFSHRSA